jgi:hypothetical protein
VEEYLLTYDMYIAPEEDTDYDVYVMADPVGINVYPMLKVNTRTRTNKGVVTRMAPEYLDGLKFCSAKDKQRVYKLFGNRQGLHQRMQQLHEAAIRQR